MPPGYVAAGASHQGLVRGNNEDRIHCDPDRGIFLVADGMGGHAAGENAAEIAVDTIRKRLDRQTGAIETRVREAIALANNAIFEAAHTRPEWAGMACVLTLAVLDDGHAVVGHVGDSRLYKIRAGEILKLTHDHSPVGEREDREELSEEQAMRHPRRNEVFRDVGSRERTPDDESFIEVLRVPFDADSALLLCSDGLSDVVPSREIREMVESHAGDPRAAATALIDAANSNSKDNVSVVLVEGPRFRPAGGVAQPKARKPRVWPYLLLGTIAGAALAFGGQLLYRALYPPPHVPRTIYAGESLSIPSALDQAQPGDTIVAAPGEFSEPVRLKSGVNLLSQKAGATTLKGRVSADGVRGARFSGFRILAGDVGIAIKDGDLEIDRVEISGARSAAVLFSGTAAGSLSGSFLHGNAGIGIAIRDHAAPSIENNRIVENAKYGIEILSPEHPALSGNTILGGIDAIATVKPDESIARLNYFALDTKSKPRIRIIGIAPAGVAQAGIAQKGKHP